MSRVLVLAEGRTEQAFVVKVLAPELGTLGIHLSAVLIGKPGHKGGIRSYQRVRKDILSALKQDPETFCTTMFDYYGLPQDWPGVAEAKSHPPRDAVSRIESAIVDDIHEQMGGPLHPPRFRLHRPRCRRPKPPEPACRVRGALLQSRPQAFAQARLQANSRHRWRIKDMLTELTKYRSRILARQEALIPDIRWDGTRRKSGFVESNQKDENA